MVPAAPSSTVLNVRLTAEKLELESHLREALKEKRDLQQENASLTDLIAQLERTQRELRDHLKRLLRDRRGPALLQPGQSLLFDGSLDGLTTAIESLASPEQEPVLELDPEDALVPDAEEPTAKPPKKVRDRAHRKIDESNLRKEIRRSELSQEERRCPETGVELVEVDVKVTTELHYERAELVLIEHHQVVYGPSTEVAQERKIERLAAPAPPVAVEGATASASLLAWLLNQKYVLHLPLYRQEDAFARLGVRLSRQTLCDWVLKCAFALRPIADEIGRRIRAGPVLQLDDTPIKVKREAAGSSRMKVRQSYLWVLKNPEISAVVFRFTQGRSADDLASILASSHKDDPVEVIVGDGYEGNRAGTRAAGMQVRYAGCWAHLLRKFRDALIEAPNAMGLYMKDISEIYAIEAQAHEQGLDPAARLELRRKEAMPIVVNLMRLTSNWKETYSLDGKVAAVMKYARNQRRALLEFLRDGRVPIDNNTCERAIRPVAVGRRNWLFAGAVEGAHAAATIYTLVESAKKSGVDPLAYLEAILDRVARWPASRIDELMPWRMTGELPAFRGGSAEA